MRGGEKGNRKGEEVKRSREGEASWKGDKEKRRGGEVERRRG